MNGVGAHGPSAGDLGSEVRKGGKKSLKIESVHCYLEITHDFIDCFRIFCSLQNALNTLSSFNPHSIIMREAC